MSFLLMIFLVLVCWIPSYPALGWERSPGGSVLLTAAAVLLVGLHACWLSRRVCRALARDPAQREQVLSRYERSRSRHQIVLIAAFVLMLAGLGWGWVVHEWWPAVLPGLEVVTLLPFLLGQVLSWLFFYDADRAACRAAHLVLESDAFAPTCLEGRQAPPAPFEGRWSYVTFQLRQKLALVFIPVALVIVQQELARRIPSSWLQGPGVVFGTGLVGLATVFVGMPLLIRVVLGLKPMPPGPLRDRLLAAARRLRFRASNILLWNTHSGMANAMVIGLVPWLRYVVFTDRLLEEFREEEVEAVFGHEVGHVRHQHMFFYLLFLVGSIFVLALVAKDYLEPWIGVLLTALGTSTAAEAAQLRENLMVFPVMGLVVAYIFAVFGYLSRRCERQADVFGCRAVSCGSPGCRGHDPETTLTAGGSGLCVTGIRIFIGALEKVAAVNGINRERPGFLQSWQHSTIARRVDFLDQVIVDPAVEARFQRRLGLLKWGMMAVLGLAMAVLLGVHGWPT
jgi:Zn-dependent protease with chaperone function